MLESVIHFSPCANESGKEKEAAVGMTLANCNIRETRH